VKLRAIPLAMAVAAAGLLTACASPQLKATDLAATQPNALPHYTTAVVVNCLFKEQVRPSSFTLTCADGYDYLSGLHWVSWGNEAFAVGTEHQNTCQPYCAAGKEVSYPALVVLWRPQPLPGHPGVTYFTRITRIYTNNRPPQYNCQGTRTCYPVTSTLDLWR
jgi:hypothetical protein